MICARIKIFQIKIINQFGLDQEKFCLVTLSLSLIAGLHWRDKYSNV